MSINQLASEQASINSSDLNLEADVLVIGGGPAGAWAAYNAAAQGVRVVLVDKGYCGSSGATASGGTSVWYAKDPQQREAVLTSRESLGGYLSERSWMERVLDQTHNNLYQLEDWGYPFPSDQQGKSYYPSLQQGAEYMRLMRKKVKKAGVQILDHSPALELLIDQEGAVAGATGTVRGTGGIQIIDNSCATSVPGLYAAGDAATRELICGGFTGGGSHNAAWAMSSGYWAGQGAAKYALELGSQVNQRQVHPIGQAGIRSQRNHTFNPQEIVNAVQKEVTPYDRNYFRTEDNLKDSLGRLHSLWQEVSANTSSDASQTLRARESAAMVATARWMYTSALARKESRGMHKLEDYPHQDPHQQYRLLSGGLDTVWVKPEQQVVKKELVAL